MPAPTRSADQSSGGSVCIKGGQIVNDDSMFLADVLIEDGVIKQVGQGLQPPSAAKVVDASGKLVLPGGIDAHTHLQLSLNGVNTVDDFLIGSKAALAGGTTTVIDTVFGNPTESLLTAYERWRAMAEPKITCNLGLSVVVGSWTGRSGEEMAQLAKEKGVNSFVFHMGLKNEGFMLRDDQLYQALIHSKQVGAIARVHAENGDIVQELEKKMLSLGISGPEGYLQSRPEQLEAEAISRACILGKSANCPLYILHITSKGAAQAVAKHRKKGAIVFGEGALAALGTDGTHYFNKCWRHAAGHVVSPPLRPDPSTPADLMDMLAGGELYLTGSDHRAYGSEQRSVGGSNFTRIPRGASGVEERLSVIWEKGVHTGKMDPMRFVAVTSTNAAKLFNLYPKKGRIAVGADGDIVVWDPTGKRKVSARSHMSASDFNIFEGLTCHGVPTATICGGRVVFESDQVLASPGSGKLLSLPTHSPYVFGVVQQRDRVCQPERVERTDAPGGRGESKIVAKHTDEQQEAFHNRPLTSAGQRNQLDSSFAVSGVQIDDSKSQRSQTKISQPPGGKSSALW